MVALNNDQDIFSDDFDPSELIEQEARDAEDQYLLEAGAKPCEWCNRPIMGKAGCTACTVPSKQHLVDGWKPIRHLPDLSKDDYIKLLNRFGFKDWDLIEYFNEYTLAMMRHYKEFTAKEFAVAHHLFSECKRSGRVLVKYQQVEDATGVDRNTVKGRNSSKYAGSVLDKLCRLGLLEDMDGDRKNFYLRLTWNPKHEIGISLARRDEAFRLAMMAPQQKVNYKNKKKSSARKAKLRK
ncbi:MAG: hypothetical protein ACR2NF_03260 [Pirellulales bacterium]